MAPRCATLNLVVVVFLAVTGWGTTKNANPDRCLRPGFFTLLPRSNLPKSLRYAAAMMLLIIHSSITTSARTAKPPLRSGDDAGEGSILNRRVLKKPRFLVRGDNFVALLSRNYLPGRVCIQAFPQARRQLTPVDFLPIAWNGKPPYKTVINMFTIAEDAVEPIKKG